MELDIVNIGIGIAFVLIFFLFALSTFLSSKRGIF